MRVQLLTSGRYRELPVELDALGIAFLDNGHDFAGEHCDGWNASMKTVTGNGRKLDLDHVEPACRFGRVDELEGCLRVWMWLATTMIRR